MELSEMKIKFDEAYAIRFSKEDIDWKPTLFKDKATGMMKEGKPLAYLNWAVAWRAMKQIYPDANYRVVETPEGSPLWNINGYGMVKTAVSAMGVEHIETFPIMQGGRNDSMKIEEIDGRDVNDSIQRGLTKAVARFGIGLYIYEGKLESGAPASANKPTNYNPLHSEPIKQAPVQPTHNNYQQTTNNYQQTTTEPQQTYTPNPQAAVKVASPKQMAYINMLKTTKGVDDETIIHGTGIDCTQQTLMAQEANKIITFLNGLPNKPKEAPTEYIEDDQLPF